MFAFDYREALDKLMEDAKCEIISTRSSGLVDAYVLRLVGICLFPLRYT